MAPTAEPLRVLFVCTGNICRSPSAEGVLREQARIAGLADRLEVESAGLGRWHLGHPPDPRAMEAAERRGYALGDSVARLVSADDFDRFDLVLAMDRGHLRELQRMCPRAHADKVRLFAEFARDHQGRDVPDPYYGGPSGFETMMDLIEDGVAGLLAELRGRAAS